MSEFIKACLFQLTQGLCDTDWVFRHSLQLGTLAWKLVSETHTQTGWASLTSLVVIVFLFQLLWLLMCSCHICFKGTFHLNITFRSLFLYTIQDKNKIKTIIFVHFESHICVVGGNRLKFKRPFLGKKSYFPPMQLWWYYGSLFSNVITKWKK